MIEKLNTGDEVVIRLVEGSKSIVKDGIVDEIDENFVVVSLLYDKFDISCQIHKEALDKTILAIKGKNFKKRNKLKYNINIAKTKDNTYQGTLFENGRWVRNFDSQIVKASNLEEAYNELENKFRRKYSDLKFEENPYTIEET